ncbi:MAG: cell wall-binding repeat-containing protein, partial [Coriobacteriia bacterium]|nr:cell wall-binding repeat-containing protein [Coriobacteriia bacterium]
SQAAFSSTAPAVVLASGEDYADALSGSALAGATSGALLLTARDSLPLATSVELSRLAPKAVYVLGGESAVSAEVERAVRTLLPSASIERIAGADRYETAYLAAEEVYALAPGNTAIVVSGKAWADAASASAVAYGQKAPILLTAPDVLSEEAEQYLSERRPSIILVVGGEAVLSSDIDVRIRSITGRIATRLAGANRYETSAAVARWAIGFPAYFTYDEVYMATGATFADALTGGSLAGVKRKPLLLTAADYCPSGTAAFLTERKLGIGQIYLFGGEAAISERGRDAIDAVMMQ